MPILELTERAGFFVFDEGRCRAAGAALRDAYSGAEPFPHIVLSDLVDAQVLRDVVSEFPSSDGIRYYDRAQERLKYQYSPNEWTGCVTHNLFAAFNSQAFVGFLEELTGSRGLIVDPSYQGGGLHETKVGGHLGIHADFNLHKHLNVVRQLNLLVYLNDDWPAEYGGNLELWDRGMEACRVSVPPVLGTSVIFTTSLDSFHGQPDPVTCPIHRSRRSMALYYYLAPKDGLSFLPDRTTRFRIRPQSNDQPDWRIKRMHLLNDWLPPIVRRQLAKLRKL